MRSAACSSTHVNLQLESTWCLSYQECKDAMGQDGDLQTIVSTNSLATFYQHVNNICVTRHKLYFNLFLFKDGVEPYWESERFAKGGRFSICTRNPDNNVEELWHDVLDLCIGGDNLDDAAWMSVCGCQVAMRGATVPKLYLWVDNAQDEILHNIAHMLRHVTHARISFQTQPTSAWTKISTKNIACIASTSRTRQAPPSSDDMNSAAEWIGQRNANTRSTTQTNHLMVDGPPQGKPILLSALFGDVWETSQCMNSLSMVALVESDDHTLSHAMNERGVKEDAAKYSLIQPSGDKIAFRSSLVGDVEKGSPSKYSVSTVATIESDIDQLADEIGLKADTAVNDDDRLQSCDTLTDGRRAMICGSASTGKPVVQLLGSQNEVRKRTSERERASDVVVPWHGAPGENEDNQQVDVRTKDGDDMCTPVAHEVDSRHALRTKMYENALSDDGVVKSLHEEREDGIQSTGRPSGAFMGNTETHEQCITYNQYVSCEFWPIQWSYGYPMYEGSYAFDAACNMWNIDSADSTRRRPTQYQRRRFSSQARSEWRRNPEFWRTKNSTVDCDNAETTTRGTVKRDAGFCSFRLRPAVW